MRRWYVWLPISGAILLLLLWRARPWEAIGLAAGGDPLPLGGAFALNAVLIGAWAARSTVLMAAVGSPLTLLELVPVVTFANTVNNLTTAAVGEVLRAIVLKSRHGVPYGHSTAVILSERLWAIGLFLVTAVAAGVGTLIPATVPLIFIAWVAAAVLAFAPTYMYRLGLRPGRAFGWLATRIGWRRIRWLADKLTEVDDGLAEIVLRPRPALIFIAATGTVMLAFAGQLWLILLALHVQIAFAGVWAAYGLAICAGVLSALPFGLGATDAVLAVLLVAQGVPAPAAAAAAILLRALATLPLGVAGAVSWIYLGRGRSTRTEPANPA